MVVWYLNKCTKSSDKISIINIFFSLVLLSFWALSYSLIFFPKIYDRLLWTSFPTMLRNTQICSFYLTVFWYLPSNLSPHCHTSQPLKITVLHADRPHVFFFKTFIYLLPHMRENFWYFSVWVFYISLDILRSEKN